MVLPGFSSRTFTSCMASKYSSWDSILLRFVSFALKTICPYVIWFNLVQVLIHCLELSLHVYGCCGLLSEEGQRHELTLSGLLQIGHDLCPSYFVSHIPPLLDLVN